MIEYDDEEIYCDADPPTDPHIAYPSTNPFPPSHTNRVEFSELRDRNHSLSLVMDHHDQDPLPNNVEIWWAIRLGV